MDAITMQKMHLPSLQVLRRDFPAITFTQDESFHWSPKLKTVFYEADAVETIEKLQQLFHEIGHAVCGHTKFTSGIQLLRLETEAWARAKVIARKYGITIQQTKIEQCLDSYRDWLHLRSSCPNCTTVATEIEDNTYRCFTCLQQWKVPLDQRSRRYRLKQAR